MIIYTSDHGQNLLDEGIVTHCGQSHPPAAVANVPFFVMTKLHGEVEELRSASSKNFNKVSHFNIFKYVVNLMGYEADALEFKYDSSILDDLEGSRAFYTGNIFGNANRILFPSDSSAKTAVKH